MLPEDGNLGLCPNVADPDPLGWVLWERKETDLLTLLPKSETLDVRLSMLLSLLWPLMNLLLSLSIGTSNGGLSLSSIVCGSFPCLLPANRPNTLEELVEKEGIPAAGPD